MTQVARGAAREPPRARPECGPARERSTAFPQYSLILYRQQTAAPWRTAASLPHPARAVGGGSQQSKQQRAAK